MFDIRMLNDDFRRTFRGGKVVLTSSVANLSPDALVRLQSKVRSFQDFTEDNDPWGEHDFGSIDLDGGKFFFKIDYYDPTCKSGSEDPRDPEKTVRVLTIMRADEW